MHRYGLSSDFHNNDVVLLYQLYLNVTQFLPEFVKASYSHFTQTKRENCWRVWLVVLACKILRLGCGGGVKGLLTCKAFNFDHRLISTCFYHKLVCNDSTCMPQSVKFLDKYMKICVWNYNYSALENHSSRVAWAHKGQAIHIQTREGNERTSNQEKLDLSHLPCSLSCCTHPFNITSSLVQRKPVSGDLVFLSQRSWSDTWTGYCLSV